jgi:hypothetical protein
VFDGKARKIVHYVCACFLKKKKKTKERKVKKSGLKREWVGSY